MAGHRGNNYDNRFLLLESENRELRAKIECLEAKLNAMAEKLDPMVRQWYQQNQPRTPRGPTRLTYKNQHGPDTHGYYIVKILYDIYPEGLDEIGLKDQVKIALSDIGKNYNPSAFSRGANDSLRNKNAIKDAEGIFYYAT